MIEGESTVRGLKIFSVVLAIIAVSAILTVSLFKGNDAAQNQKTVPYEEKYGIYMLDLATEKLTLIYSTPNEIYTSALRLSDLGDRFVFAQKIDGANDDDMEIFAMGVDGKGLKRLTNNSFWDLYPVWSPDDTQIAFLSKRERDLDIYMMNEGGSDQHKLFDSGSNDADIDWVNDTIVFTSKFKIWSIESDGSRLTQITNLPNAGQWGEANLPMGDYDPRLRRDGMKIVFERLENPNSLHGNYNIYTVNPDGTAETRLTSTGYSQGLASWSHSGDKIAYIVAAIDNEGKYDIYMMNADGTNNHNVTPDYFPNNFLCHSPIFSKDDSKIFFIGQWLK